MRIVHVIDSMEVGGAEVIVATLCRLHRDQGHHPSVLCLFRIGALGERLRAEGFSVECIGPASLPVLLWRLLLKFRQLRPGVVHCHNAMATIAGALPARCAGARVISTRHGLVAPPHNFRRELKFSFAALACDRVVGVCDATAANLRRLPLARYLRIERVYNGAASAPQPAGARIRKGFTLVSVGRLVPLKDLETLLRAIALARARIQGLRLIIVGDGPHAPVLKQRAEELGITCDTEFVGETGNVWPYLQSADVFVMSSRSEGLPMSLLEAMSAGLPAIATNVGGMGEVVKLTGAGLVVPVSDAESFADAIVELAEDRAKFETLSAAAIAGYRRYFSPDKMATAYLGLYGAEKKIQVTEETPARVGN